jgi:hypothetical protein
MVTKKTAGARKSQTFSRRTSKIRDEIKEAVLAAAAASDGAGNLPAGVKRLDPGHDSAQDELA